MHGLATITLSHAAKQYTHPVIAFIYDQIMNCTVNMFCQTDYIIMKLPTVRAINYRIFTFRNELHMYVVNIIHKHDDRERVVELRVEDGLSQMKLTTKGRVICIQ